MGIGTGQPAFIRHSTSHGKMIQALKGIIGQSQQLMDGVVEKTADTGPTNTLRFGLQVEDLSDVTRRNV